MTSTGQVLLLLIATIFIISCPCWAITYEGFKVIRVRAAGRDRDKLESWIDSKGDNVDVWSSKYLEDDPDAVEKDVMIPPPHNNDFNDLNLDREVLIEDVEQHQHSIQDRDTLTTTSGDFVNFGLKRYHFYSEFLEYYRMLEEEHDFISTQTIGETHNDRQIRIVKICRPKGTCGSKPGIFVEAGKYKRPA